jgi:hypothetical protein
MSAKNLWGDLSALEIVRTPKDILKEQASFLTKATEGVLVGNVDEMDANGDFRYDLDVQVPSLNDYTYTLLSITHGIDLYPVRVSARAAGLTETCDDEKDFEAVLRKVLSSKEVKLILSRLLSQAS